MMIQSINPYTREVIASYSEINLSELSQIIQKTANSFQKWKKKTYKERSVLFIKMAEFLRKNLEQYAVLISSEMGKIIKESKAEIEKCALLCEYYAENTEKLLTKEYIQTDANTSYIRFDPIGVIFAIMPWNFPFWQVLRAAVPTLMAGNTVVLKHAPNVMGCAIAIEELFTEVGFPQNVFRNLMIPVELSEQVIAHPAVSGVTLTGSVRAGRSVAEQAGKNLKKCVLELGGSDPYIVLNDSDFELACHTGFVSRMLNAGQVCIAAKRFIVETGIYDQFIEKQKVLIKNLKIGNPLLEETDMGPMAREDLLITIENQVKKSVNMGAKVVIGGKRFSNNSLFYEPTLITNVTKEMPVYNEETFGPVSVVIKAKNTDDAIKVANETNMGLGASIWTKNISVAEKIAKQINAGAVFINGMTKSDPRLPFGGTKNSGFGRELGAHGIKEFLNIKTVYIK